MALFFASLKEKYRKRKNETAKKPDPSSLAQMSGMP